MSGIHDVYDLCCVSGIHGVYDLCCVSGIHGVYDLCCVSTGREVSPAVGCV